MENYGKSALINSVERSGVSGGRSSLSLAGFCKIAGCFVFGGKNQTGRKRYPAMALDTSYSCQADFKSHQQEFRRLASRCFAER